MGVQCRRHSSGQKLRLVWGSVNGENIYECFFLQALVGNKCALSCLHMIAIRTIG